jgi:peptidoglycan/LPS O-acetylase OafA/YrhL
MQDDLRGFLIFFVKRFFRIYPLLWLATFGTLFVFSYPFDRWKILLNVTGLFGFIKWDAYIATGAWSIGNELVFYIFFPIFIVLSKRSCVFFRGFSILILAVGMYFAFVMLDPTKTFDQQWKDYVNPLNQVYLFLAGFWIGSLSFGSNPKSIWIMLSTVIALVLFVVIPVSGAQVNLVTGWNRVIFSALCIVVCFGFYKGKLEVHGIIGKFLSLMGEVSYSIYLLHPIVFWILANSLDLVGIERLWYAFPATLLVSVSSYFALEKPFMKLGAHLSKKIQTPSS